MARDRGFWKRGLVVVLAAGGVYFHAVAEAATRYAAGAGAGTGNWSATATWNSTGCGNATNNPTVPGAADDAIICPNRTVVVSANQAALTITVNNTGILRMGNSGTARTLTVSGNITVNVGGRFDANPAFAAQHLLAHTGAGNIINDGTINFANTGSGNNAACNVTFSGWTGSTRTVSGTGTTAFNRVTINSAGNTINDIVEVTAANFSMAAIGIAAPSVPLVLTDGTFKLSTAATIAPFGTAAFTLAANDRFWLNHASAVVNYPVAATFTINAGELRIENGTFNATANVATAMNVTSGALRVTGGTLNVGSAVNNTLLLTNNAASTIEMTSGAINVAGRLASSTTGGAGIFNMSNGTITVGTVGNNTNNALNAPFFIGSAVSYTRSGGTIEIQNANTQANAREYDVRSITSSVTGGTLRIGNNSTVAVQTFQINSVPFLWDLEVANNAGLTSDPTAILISALTVGGNVSIGAETTLNANNLNISVAGSWTTNGTLTPGTGTVTFAGAGPQTLSGAAANTSFYNVTVSNANGLTLTGAHDMIVWNTLNFTVDGAIITTGTNLVQIGRLLPTVLVGSVTNAGANRFVNGNLQRVINAIGTYDFDVGSISANRWSPVQVQLGAFTTAGFLRVSTASGDHAQIASSGFDAAKSVNRTWTLTNTGLVFGANANNRVRFTFVAADIDSLPVPATPANFHIGRYTGSWTLTPPPTPNAQPLFTEMSGTTLTSVTLTGDFQVAEKTPVVTPPDSFNAVEVGAAVTGRISTKLRSANFTLDIVAIQGGAQQNTFNEAVTIDVVTGGSAGADCGGAVVSTIAGPTDVTLASGRVTTANINVATAYPNVRVRIRYPATGPPYTITTCSSDNFSIKPTAFSITSTDATNTGTGVGATIKTGATFNLTAAGGAGYAGTPGTNFSGNVTGTPTAGTLGPVGAGFLAADGAGTASGTFYYGEVGNFGLAVDAVRDTSFTSVDLAGTDCVASSTSDPVGGPYGCWVGSTAVAPITGLGFGRFIPDNFNVAYTTPPIFGTTCGTFTYVGTLFTYPGSTGIMTVTARRGTANGLLDAPAVNYAGSYAKLTTATLNQAPYNTKAARYTRFDALNPSPTPALDHTGLPDTATDPTVSAFASGVGTLTFSSGTGLMFTRDPATPNGPFNADIALALNVIDSDSVVFGGNPASFGTATAGNGISFSGGKAMRYGRLRLVNANGSQLVPLSMLMETQYWNGSSFITNADDNCTSLGTASVGLGNYTANLAAGETTATIAAGNFSKGRKMLTLSAPGALNNGGVDVVLNLGTTTTIDSCVATWDTTPTPTGANLVHLRGRWCGATHTKDPTARATFGARRGSEEVIHMRENF